MRNPEDPKRIALIQAAVEARDDWERDGHWKNIDNSISLDTLEPCSTNERTKHDFELSEGARWELWSGKIASIEADIFKRVSRKLQHSSEFNDLHHACVTNRCKGAEQLTELVWITRHAASLISTIMHMLMIARNNNFEKFGEAMINTKFGYIKEH